ncbi:MAG: signal peptidase I [Planctomycetales bacterium]|nr:signal peptidase I [Planctomycetales bacterium]MCA9167302.1 signal peptidase I [Planctomycetales bacterium]
MSATFAAPSSVPAKHQDPEKARREAVESIVVAIVLAFLFRAFEAEAFVIPTGSMAPTLQGRHKDLNCPECGFLYRTGATADMDGLTDNVQAVKCPMCFYTVAIDPRNPQHKSHSGDRILVNKFAYEAPFGEPDRWDVIVFKYPGNAKQNYIKRLVGLPHETIRIRHGDIFVQDNGADATDDKFHIARKSHEKIPYLLQDVHDTAYQSETLKAVGWPLNWQPGDGSSAWQSPDAGATYECPATPEVSWLNFRQHELTFDMWDAVLQIKAHNQQVNSEQVRTIPVTDFYAYNAHSDGSFARYSHPRPMGDHWVGDLAVDADFEIQGDTGQVAFDLIEGGRHHQCVVDVATGKLTLQINEGQFAFSNDAGEQWQVVSADTTIKGPGNYRLRFANLDDELHVWINDSYVTFDRPTTYQSPESERPVWSSADPGDMQPVRVGVSRTPVKVNQLRVLRDIYYIATNSTSDSPIDYPMNRYSLQMISEHLKRPQDWRNGDLFDDRRQVEFKLDADQFFPLGDNSPYSKDGRMWGREYYVERELLIGKAVLVYWPHGWPLRVPIIGRTFSIWPNFRRMGLIH